MTTTSKSVQSFTRSTNRLASEATREGVNVSKAQVTKALSTLTADGKVSRADVAAAKAFLEKAPLTAGAKSALKEFIGSGGAVRGGGEGGGSVRGGGESGGGRGGVRGGGEAGGGGRVVVRGGGESGRGGRVVIRGGGESGGGGYVRGGGE
jgi:hypothetical protein